MQNKAIVEAMEERYTKKKERGKEVS